ncbi:hypothetical protein B0H13DRAFT_2301850 [Mycena leptocephala]|nr:hypothetical protein B0H13DRAFT_2301850 [Mycena leptocephala]
MVVVCALLLMAMDGVPFQQLWNAATEYVGEPPRSIAARWSLVNGYPSDMPKNTVSDLTAFDGDRAEAILVFIASNFTPGALDSVVSDDGAFLSARRESGEYIKTENPRSYTPTSHTPLHQESSPPARPSPPLSLGKLSGAFRGAGIPGRN